MKNSTWFSLLQKIGQSLMLPVSVLPAAGLLVALGRVIQNSTSAEESSVIFKTAGEIFFNGGIAIFQQLPVIFAVGVAIGFTSGAGIAALAAAVCYFTMANVLTVMTTALALTLKIDTGVFGGILSGALSAYLYNNYQNIQLHPIFGFFSGKRLVPILSAGSAIVLGLVLSLFWPPIQAQIQHFGEWVMNSWYGPAFYAAGKRLLIPLGLHHVYYPPFLYQFGEFTTAAGTVLKGETARYFAGDPTAGRFMAAEFPLMLFGLPAAAYAMYLKAPLAKRKAVGGIMLAAALTSIITGITEPIEFAFIFVAPLLYIFHVLAAFCSGLLISTFDIHLGYTFSASLIDWFLGYFNQKNSFWLFAVVGPIIAAVYFTVFYFAIGLFNFKTPGRDDETSSSDSPSSDSLNPQSDTEMIKANQVLLALGGSQNIKSIDACITRLRLEVNDSNLVKDSDLKKLGASGTMKISKNSVQVVFGVQSDRLKDQIKKVIQNKTATKFILQSPLKGKIIDLQNVKDKVFSQKIMGEGFAILPTEGLVLSPCDGEIVSVIGTSHAVGILAKNGAEILIHVGLDTVKMKGDGFKTFIKVSDQVKKGQKLIEFSIEKILSFGLDTTTPIVITNSDQCEFINKTSQDQIVDFQSIVIELKKK